MFEIGRKDERIRLSVAAADPGLLGKVLDALERFQVGTCDVDFGWSIYEGKREARVDVTLHESGASRAITVWLILRAHVDGIDCGRVYLADGRDFCCKHLHNLESAFYNNVESFPDHNF